MLILIQCDIITFTDLLWSEHIDHKTHAGNREDNMILHV